MNFEVNYLWICSGPDTKIPSHLFRNLQDNAERYSGAVFNLWVEDDSVFKGYHIPPNVKAHHLSSIPSFSEIIDPVKGKDAVWLKVDMARLLVLKRVLSTTQCRAALYTDFDVPDIQLTAEKLLRRLDTHGMAFGAAYVIRNGHKQTFKYFENSFMAFTPEASRKLDALVANSFVELSSRRRIIDRIFCEPQRNRIYRAMLLTLEDLAYRKNISPDLKIAQPWKLVIAGFLVAPASRWYAPKEQKAKLALSSL